MAVQVSQRNQLLIVDLESRAKIGPYILTRDLGPTAAFGRTGGSAGHTHPADLHPYIAQQSPSAAPQPDRFLALHENHQTSHVAYRFQPAKTKAQEAAFVAAVEAASLLDHPHALKIQQFTFDITGQAWIITPFAGDVDGLRTLTRLLREKGGQMVPLEAERAVHQLLTLIAAAHTGEPIELAPGADDKPAPRAVPCHGALSMDEILVDRHGCLLVELYGLARAMAPTMRAGDPSLESLRDEIRSVVEIGYQLITGLRAEEPLIPAGRLVKRLDPRWDAWLSRGLDPSGGFDTADAALAALPTQSAAFIEAKADRTVVSGRR